MSGKAAAPKAAGAAKPATAAKPAAVKPAATKPAAAAKPAAASAPKPAAASKTATVKPAAAKPAAKPAAAKSTEATATSTTPSFAAARPSVAVHKIDGAGISTQVALPSVFIAPIRPDIVHFVHTKSATAHTHPQCSAESSGMWRRVRGGVLLQNDD